MKVYYAHPISDYNTEQEATVLLELKKLGFDVLNPNGIPLDKEYNKYKDFNIFLEAIDRCDAVAFSSFDDGQISSGVALELLHAKRTGKPIFEFPKKLEERILSREKTVERLKIMGIR